MNSVSFYPPAAASILPSSTEETILVVDDQPALCEVAEILLSRCGYRVLRACDASEAKEIVCDNPNIDLLLTDIEMPGMPGDELAEWFRATRPHGAVVFMSGNPMQQRRLDGSPFIEKPFVHLDALVSTIRKALRDAHAARKGAPAAA
jgi:two-component system, cell cycle sensor histidine kinase and response regulator CckA